MAVVLAYVDAVPGRLYPLVPTMQELVGRGHRVAVRCGRADVELLRSVGLPTQSIASEIDRFEPQDWRARTRFGALRAGLGQFGERAPFQVPDLERAIEAERPDVLPIDEGAWGAAAAAERSGFPWGSPSSRRCRFPHATPRPSASASRPATTSSGESATGWFAVSPWVRSSE